MIEFSTQQLKEADDKNTKEINDLLVQLTDNCKPLSNEQLQTIITAGSTYIYVAMNNQGEIIGMISLVIYPIPDDLHKCWIEDAVVDEKFRGQGIGEALLKTAVEKAKEIGVKTIELTSNPKREAANKLYQKLGFMLYETNCYKLTI